MRTNQEQMGVDLTPGEGIGENEFFALVHGPPCHFGCPDHAVPVHADDVAADAASLVEQVKAQRGMLLRDVLEHLAHGCAFGLQHTRAACDGAQHGRDLNADHVAYISTLMMRGSSLATSLQLSPTSVLAYTEPELVPK